MVSNITINGFYWGGGYVSLWLNRATNIVVKNSIFAWTGLNNAHIDIDSRVTADFTNCVFGFAEGRIRYCRLRPGDHQELCGPHDALLRDHAGQRAVAGGPDRIEIANCCLYACLAGGIRFYDAGGTMQVYSTQADISAGRYFDYGGGKYFAMTNCIAKNPGFARYMGWDGTYRQYNALYDNSPLLNAGKAEHSTSACRRARRP